MERKRWNSDYIELVSKQERFFVKILQALSRLNVSWQSPTFEKNTLTVNERNHTGSSESMEINAARDNVTKTLQSKKKALPTVKELNGKMPPPPPPPPTKTTVKDANGEVLALKIPYKMKYRFDATQYKAVRQV